MNSYTDNFESDSYFQSVGFDENLALKLKYSFKDIDFDSKNEFDSQSFKFDSFSVPDFELKDQAHLTMNENSSEKTNSISNWKDSDSQGNDRHYREKNQTSRKQRNKKPRKRDNKKNLPGLVRDRVLSGIKKIMKTTKFNSTFDGMKRMYKSMKINDQARLKYIYDKIQSKEGYMDLKQFLGYLKESYNKIWKKCKTWKKLKEFLTIREHEGACNLIRGMINDFVFGEGILDQQSWLNNFKGKNYVKIQLESSEFKENMKDFIESL